MEGTSGPDVIWGGHTIDGRGGDHLICSLNGPDKVYGGEGDDRIDGGDNQDTIEGGPGDDHLIGGNNHYAGVPGGETLSYEHASGPVNVDLTRGIAYGEGTDTLVDFMEIIGSDYGDTLRGSSKLRENGNYIDGRGGDDVIYGSQVNRQYFEVIIGGEGNDSLHGVRGYDLLFGDEGDDNLYGGRRGDRLTGGPGEDHMDGGIDGDCVSYGDLNLGNMMIFPGSESAVTASLATGAAEGDGADSFVNVECLRGSEHDDFLSGNGDPNTLFGNGGNDVLKTWRGDDKLYDGPGTDRLLGGRGSDFLTWDDGRGWRHFRRQSGHRRVPRRPRRHHHKLRALTRTARSR